MRYLLEDAQSRLFDVSTLVRQLMFPIYGSLMSCIDENGENVIVQSESFQNRGI